ncbi:MAG: diacylglycerol kinase [Puniceicoccales bacterium]|jgi:diacylglycerol kinase (ATP)|nr:diacylglycerol kinase [Puniceicoccales bacterium]
MQRKFFRKFFRLFIVFFWRYVVNPLSYSISGMRFMRHERPFRMELVCGIIVLPVCFWIFGWGWELLLLTVDFFILLIAECLNTAIESVVDFSAQSRRFPLAKKAKDTASAAVYIALCNAIVSATFLLSFRLFGTHLK